MVAFIRKSGGCYNACDPGLGKSVQTIAVMDTMGMTYALFIVPASMRYTWEAEILKFSKRFKPQDILVIAKGSDLKKIKDQKIFITSYSIAASTKGYEALSKMTLSLLVLDESHAVKTPGTKRTRAILGNAKIKGLWNNFTAKICLSGTPFTTSVVDGFTLFKRLAPTKFGTFSEYVKRYAYAEDTPYGTSYYGVRNYEELRKIIRENFYFRYVKSEVLKELPPKVYKKVVLGPEYLIKSSKSEQQKLDESTKAILAALKEDKSYQKLILSMAGERRVQGEIKVPAVAEYARELLEEGTPILIFAHHTNVIANLKNMLSDWNPLVIDGSTSAKERFSRMNDFQTGKSNLFIGQYVAAGTGITLNRASDVLLAELEWDPATIIQATDRAHRIGQINTVFVHFFVVKDSLEEAICTNVMEKVKTFEKVL